MSDQGLTAADRLRGLASQSEAEDLPFICGRDDIEDAADAVEACDGVAYEDLRYLAARGGLAALIEAVRGAERSIRGQADIHALRDAPGLAKVTHLMADKLAALLPPVGESETPTDHANVSPLPDAEAEALGYPNPGVGRGLDDAWARGAATALHALTVGFREHDLAQHVAREIHLSTDRIANCGLEPSTAARVIDALSKREVEG